MTTVQVPDANMAIQARNLNHKYRSRPSIINFNIDLPSGHFAGLMGENGCGKTTFLKILAGMISEYTGDVWLFGKRPGLETKSFVSFLPDTSFLNFAWKPSDAIAYFTDFFPDFNPSKATEMMQFFGLEPNLRVREMSKGMREKLQITLTMSRNAKIYLLDEPISGIDPAAREQTLKAVLNNYAEDALVLVSTHLIHDLEPIIDYAIYMRGGTVMLAGEVDDLRATYNASLDEIFIKEYSWPSY